MDHYKSVDLNLKNNFKNENEHRLPSDNDIDSHLALIFCANDGRRRRVSFNDGGCTNRGGVPIDGDISTQQVK